MSSARLRVSVALAAVGAHATALGNGFIWLDHAHIEGGAAVAAPGHWFPLFAQGFAGTGFYRPLMAISLSIDASLGGAAWLFHATSLAWHAAAAVLTVVAGQVFGLSPAAAAGAGLLFAVHPATSIVAGAIAFRSEAMITVALLALVVFHLRRRPWPAALALLGGALTKETALVLGPLFVAAIELCGPASSDPDRRARRRLLGAEAAALALAIGLRVAFAPAWRASWPPMAPGEAVATRLAALWKTALLAIAPVDRAVCDAFPIAALASARTLGGAVVLAAIVILAARRRGPALLLALALLPSLHLAPIMRWWSPHYLYVPLAFAAMLAAEAAAALACRVPRPARGGVAVAAVVLGACCVVSLRDGLRFRSDEALWTAEVAGSGACREGHFYLAERAREANRLAEAAAHYEQAIATTARVLSYVDRAAALQNLGVTRLEQHSFADAAAAFRAALDVVAEDRRRREITHNLATAELRAGHAALAARLLEPELSRADALPQAILVRAHALRALGREREAEALLGRLRQPPPPPGRSAR